MKSFVLIGALAWALCPALMAQTETGEDTLANGIAVIVNDVVITYDDVLREIAGEYATLERRYQAEPDVLQQKLAALKKDRIEQLVENQLILHEFETAGYVLPDSIIDERVQASIRADFGDRPTMTKTLERRGESYETYRKRIRDQFIIEQMRLKNVAAEILISPYKIETYYTAHRDDFKMADQVKLRMIELDKSKHSAEGAVELAREILAKLKEGVPFADMARVYSDGPQRDQGGERDWADRQYLRKELTDVAFKLKPGQLSDVIEGPESVYLLQVEQTRAAHVKPLAEVRDEIERTLLTLQRNRLTEKWIKRLRDKSYVAYF